MNLCNNISLYDLSVNNVSVNFSENESILSKERILNFTSKTKVMPNFMSNLKSLIEKNISQNNHKKPYRHISSIPERVLDAPLLMDDYYLNLVDWSSTNILSVCLGNSVYLWNGDTQETQLLLESNNYISSVSWMETGTCIAVGLPNGSVQLWDTNKMTQIRNMSGHSQRVGALSWNKYILSSGSRDSKIFNHDVRIKDHITQCLVGHTQEICGLKWSPDGTLLASGGNDNLLCIWDVNLSSTSFSNYNPFTTTQQNNVNINLSDNFNTFDNSNFNETSRINPMINRNNQVNLENNNINNNINRLVTQLNGGNALLNLLNLNTHNPNNNINQFPSVNNHDSMSGVKYFNPKFKFTNHKSAVKALSWCPWQKGILATGGGKQDKTIKFWNAEMGTMIKSVDTNSQVCSLIWNRFEKELVSSHGYSKNQLTLWKYPEMTKITELTGHMERVLYMALSPDGTTIVSGASDETLRFWKVFQAISNDKPVSDSNKTPFMNLSSNIHIR